MTDLVGRLLAQANGAYMNGSMSPVTQDMLEAAAEIERLRAALRDIKEHSLELYATGVARAALGERNE